MFEKVDNACFTHDREVVLNLG